MAPLVRSLNISVGVTPDLLSELLLHTVGEDVAFVLSKIYGGVGMSIAD